MNKCKGTFIIAPTLTITPQTLSRPSYRILKLKKLTTQHPRPLSDLSKRCYSSKSRAVATPTSESSRCTAALNQTHAVMFHRPGTKSVSPLYSIRLSMQMRSNMLKVKNRRAFWSGLGSSSMGSQAEGSPSVSFNVCTGKICKIITDPSTFTTYNIPYSMKITSSRDAFGAALFNCSLPLHNTTAWRAGTEALLMSTWFRKEMCSCLQYKKNENVFKAFDLNDS